MTDSKSKKILLNTGVALYVLVVSVVIAVILIKFSRELGLVTRFGIIVHMYLICKLFSRGKRLLALLWVPCANVAGFILGIVFLQLIPEPTDLNALAFAVAYGLTEKFILAYLVWYEYWD